jgi:excisionase family DNA binding protein
MSQDQHDHEWLTPYEVIARYRVSRSAVYRMAARPDVRVVRIGRRIRIHRSAIEPDQAA